MATSYDDAVGTLFRAPHEGFVAQRKRLAGELKASGDKAASARLGKLARPSISAWAVNQLWWHAREAFDELFKTAELLRQGGPAAAGPHRQAIAKLRARAAKLLTEAGHPASEATLRRVTTSLAALAVTGGFDPDPPGALTADRDPPGFEAIGVLAGPSAATSKPRAETRAPTSDSTTRGLDQDATDSGAPSRTKRELAAAKRLHAAEEARKKAEAAAERRRVEKERARREAERRRLEAALRTARDKLAAQDREIDQLRKQLVKAEALRTQEQSAIEDLETRLSSA